MQDGVNEYDAGTEAMVWNRFGAGESLNVRLQRLLLRWDDRLLAASQKDNINTTMHFENTDTFHFFSFQFSIRLEEYHV